MPNPRLAARYAKSIIDLAQEKGQLEAIRQDAEYLLALCKASRELIAILRSPIIPADKKNGILQALTAGKISTMMLLFTKLLINKNREANMVEIMQEIINQYNEINGIHRVKLTTAVKIDEDIKNIIIAKAQSEARLSRVELETVVDKEIIGGFIVEFNNNLLDASILRDLKDVKRQFEKNIFISSMR